MMTRSVDYDALADSYDRRFERSEYSGVERALREFAGGGRALRAAEVGCGTGHWLGKLWPGTRVTGLDPSEQMLARAHRALPEVPLARGRAEHLPWRDASFDRLFCVNALHHFADRPTFAAEARRVLRSGGGLLTAGMDPHASGQRWWIHDYFPATLAGDLVRYPAAAEIRTLLQSAGFVRVETREVQHTPVTLPARIALEQGFADKDATSQLVLLTLEDYQQGLSRLRQAAAAARGEEPLLVADMRLYATTGWVG